MRDTLRYGLMNSQLAMLLTFEAPGGVFSGVFVADETKVDFQLRWSCCYNLTSSSYSTIEYNQDEV